MYDLVCEYFLQCVYVFAVSLRCCYFLSYNYHSFHCGKWHI